MKVSWGVLARRIAARLPEGFVQFQGSAIKRGKLGILAFYRAPAPSVPPFTLTVNATTIMNMVEQIDRRCADRLGDDELGYAQSIAGHFWQAVTLDKLLGVPDPTKRLVAALEGSFEVACMYASAEPGPYRCELQSDKHDETALEPYESGAIAQLRLERRDAR